MRADKSVWQRRDVHYEVRKRTEMEFIYAAIFDTPSGRVLIKFGRSSRPYERVKQIAMSAPYELCKASFCRVGDRQGSSAIELLIRLRLNGYRTRGEWYEFDVSDGKVFSSTVKTIFARVVGRRLQWSHVDVDAIREEGRLAAQKYHMRYYSKIRKDTAWVDKKNESP